MIGVLPGEGEALAQFNSIFPIVLTQFHWEQFSAVEATSPIEQEASEAKFVSYGKDGY